LGVAAAERILMYYAQTVFDWLKLNPSTTASVIFGGAIVAVVLSTYIYDYRILAKRGKG